MLLREQDIAPLYSRYARVKLDTLVEVHALLESRMSKNEIMNAIKDYIKAHSHLAYEDGLQPLIQMAKMRRPLNHILIGAAKAK